MTSPFFSSAHARPLNVVVDVVLTGVPLSVIETIGHAPVSPAIAPLT